MDDEPLLSLAVVRRIGLDLAAVCGRTATHVNYELERKFRTHTIRAIGKHLGVLLRKGVKAHPLRLGGPIRPRLGPGTILVVEPDGGAVCDRAILDVNRERRVESGKELH